MARFLKPAVRVLLLAAAALALVFGIEVERGAGYSYLGWLAIAAAACALVAAFLSLVADTSSTEAKAERHLQD
jgi:hypothetical protein